MFLRAAALVVLGGCEVLFPRTDDRTSGPIPPDASTLCDHRAPFTTVSPVAGLSDVAVKEVGVWLDRAELEAVITLGGPSFTSSLAIATRASVSDPFEPARPLVALNASSNATGGASVTSDGMSIYFHSIGSDTSFEILRGRRTAEGLFDTPERVAELDPTGDNLHPHLAGGDTRIWWTRATGVAYDIVSAPIDGSGFGPVDLVFGVATTYEKAPVASADQLAVYFASSQTALGSFEVRVATRPTVSDAFSDGGTIVFPMPFTTAVPAWISDDNCRLYVAGNGDVYLATRVP